MAISTQDITININGNAKGIDIASKSAAASLNRLNLAVNQLVTAQANANGKQVHLRNSTGQYTNVVKEATIVVERLKAEKIALSAVQDKLAASFSKEDQALLRSAGMMQGLSGATGSASFALLSLTQGIQDAGNFGMGMAQGIRAVNNNLQSFATAMTFAASQTKGGILAVFKNMGTAMLGPAGILFAFSAISAAVEYFSNKSQQAKSKAKELKDELSGLFAVDTIDGITSTYQGVQILTGYLGVMNAEVEKSAIGIKEAFRISGGGGKESIELMNQALEINKEQSIVLSDIIAKKKEEVAEQKKLNDFYNNAVITMGVDGLVAVLAAGRAEAKKVSDVVDRAKLIVDAGFGSESAFQAGVAAFRSQVASINPLLKITDEEFSKLVKDGETLKYLSEETEKIRKEELATLKQNTADASSEAEEWDKAWRKILGVDARMTLDDLNKEKGVPDKLFGYDMDNIIKDGERYREEQNRVIDANQRFRESFADLASDLIISGATIGGGLDGMKKTFGRFLVSYGAELIKMGMSTVVLGTTLNAVKEALANLQGWKAIAAGAALVAAGSALRAQGRSSAKALGGGSGGSGTSSYSSAPTFFSGFSNVSGIPSASPSIPSSADMRISLVASGRDLIGVIGSENEAYARVVGRGQLAFSGQATTSTPTGLSKPTDPKGLY